MKRYSYFEALIPDSTDTNFSLLLLNLDPKAKPLNSKAKLFLFTVSSLWHY